MRCFVFPLAFCFLLLFGLLPMGTAHNVLEGKIGSHPPFRFPVARMDRPINEGPAFYVDPVKGSDEASGTAEQPWRTLQASLPKLKPGDTLYLAGGVYHENVYCAIQGSEEKPITIRSRPGELAILDGGLPEFQQSPGTAWEPVGNNGEYRSSRRYPNIRDVVGLFGDSNVGLQTYWHAEDLRSSVETLTGDPENKYGEGFLYCGPGIWYDRKTGYIHARLAHTHFTHPRVVNYQGETDPRKLPLVISPFNSTPLFIDLGSHLRFQDLVIRGGGLNTVVMRFGIDITFEHVTIFGGTYGLRSKNSGPVRFLHSAIYGGIPPWGFYGENALRARHPAYSDPFTSGEPIKGERNIARLTNHALMVLEGFEESDVFAFPFNNRWEIAYSEFADGHDGIYPNGYDIRVHHNWFGDIQDDAIYLSSPTRGVSDQMHIYRNMIVGCTSAFGCHGRGGPSGTIYVYGNLVDARDNYSGRWRTHQLSEIKPYGVNFFLIHGAKTARSIESIHFYHNTAILDGNKQTFLGAAFSGTFAESPRHIANNLFVYMHQYPGLGKFDPHSEGLVLGTNYHWSPAGKPPGEWAGVEHVVDPRFAAFSADPKAVNDYRPHQALPAGKIDCELLDGVAGREAGAFPMNGEVWRAGVNLRHVPGEAVR